jgi:hypothetical protein
MMNFLLIIQFLILFMGFGSVYSMFNSTLSDIILLILNFVILSQKKSFLVSQKRLLIIFLIIFFILLHSLLTNSKIQDYFGLFFRIINVFILFLNLDFKLSKVKYYLINSIWIILILSLINLVLINTIPDLFTSIESKNGFSGFTLFYLFNYNSTINILGVDILRNQGIFWEPGVLQIPLLFLFYYLLVEIKDNKKSILVGLIILSTFSTTGIVGMLLVLIFRVLISFKSASNKFIFFFKSFTILLLFFPIIYLSINHKINDEKDNISSIARSYDLLVGLNVITNNPIVGIGIDDSRYFNEIKGLSVNILDERLDEQRGNTNALLTYFIKFGLPLTFVILYFFLKQTVFKYRVPFFFIFILVLSSEPLIFVNLWFIFLLSSVFLVDDLQQYDLYKR